MRSFFKIGWGMLPFFIGLTLCSTVLQVTSADAATRQYTGFNCQSCHSMPPQDSGTEKKNPVTGAVPGKHQTHATGLAISCNKCHNDGVNDVTSYSTSHRDKNIQLSTDLGYARKTGTFMNQTSVPPNPLSTCSTAACHTGNGKWASTTPSWGGSDSQNGNAVAACNTCHNDTPSQGSHTKHLAYYGGTAACATCHTDYTSKSGAARFQHATSAASATPRGIDVHFAASQNSGGSATFASDTCSNLYCHSNGQGISSVTTPAWKNGTATCVSCHGDASTGTLSGKHAKHVANSNLGTNYGCVDCHAATVDAAGAITNKAKHVNTFVNLSGAKVQKFDGQFNASLSCSTTYCHSDGKGNQKAVTWDQAADSKGCARCHGSETGTGSFTSINGMPNYSSLGAGATNANSHKIHATLAADCVKCHASTVNNDGTLKAGGSHTDKTINVGGTLVTYNSATKSCSTNDCHNGKQGGTQLFTAPAATWGAKLACNGCHGSDSLTLTSGTHAKHLLKAGISCEDCHSATATGSSAIKDSSKHVIGSVAVSGTTVAGFDAGKNCTTSCHNSVPVVWGGSSQCGVCHSVGGTFSTKFAEYNSNDTAIHNVHVSGTYGPAMGTNTGTSCAVCHAYTDSASATHDNQSINLNSGNMTITTGSATLAKANGGITVSNCTSCHKQSTTWAGNGASQTRLACESCHTTTNGALSVINGKTAADKTLAASEGHGSINGGTNSCTVCHDNSSAHIGQNGAKRLASALGTGDANCTYCHADSTKVTDSEKQITRSHFGFANKCTACHDPHGTSNAYMIQGRMSSVNVSFDANRNFVNDQGTGVCQVCHTDSVKTSYFQRGKANTGAHQASDADCTSCHAHNPADPAFKAFQPDGACDTCHGYPPVPRNLSLVSGTDFKKSGLYANAKFEDYSGGGGAHLVAAHLAQNITPSMGFAPCLPCHSGGSDSHMRQLPIRSHVGNVAVKIDQALRFSGDVMASYTTAKLVTGGKNITGTCFNVSCHFKPTEKWSTER